jgi:hypothetical protein
VDGKPYIYEGITDAEKQGIRRMSDDSVLQNRAFVNMAKRKRLHKAFEGDINLESISIADNDARSHKNKDLLMNLNQQTT